MSGALVIGSRGSELALAQARQVADMIRVLTPGTEVRVEIIKTQGDKIRDVPLAKIGGKGLFTKELEIALIERRIDLAVHSMKDLPTVLPDGLCIGATPKRVSPYDALVCSRWSALEELPDGALIGTSSLRRGAQLRARYPRFNVVDLRGNVGTRLAKVMEGDLHAAILACAGLERLGHAGAIRQALPLETMIPAVGQGALAIETRREDVTLRELLANLTCAHTELETRAERALMRTLEGGCQVPIGALGRVSGERLRLIACVCRVDGGRILRTELEDSIYRPEDLGKRAAEELIRQGADEIMAGIR